MESIVSRRILSVHKEHEFLLKLEAAGLGDSEAQAVIASKDNNLAERVINLIRECELGAQEVVVFVCNANSGRGISGRQLKILDFSGELVAEEETNENGEAIFNLALGDYQIGVAAMFGDRRDIHIPAPENERRFSFRTY